MFANPTAGLEPMRVEANSEGVRTTADDQRWRIEDVHIPVAGRWRMHAEILMNDFEKVMIEDNVVLPRAPWIGTIYRFESTLLKASEGGGGGGGGEKESQSIRKILTSD